MSMFEPDEVRAALPEHLSGRLDIRTAAVTGSTNNDIRAAAEQGGSEGVVIIAGEQTAGKGRLGRSFYSPKDAGLYMSILLRPRLAAADSLAITTLTAAAAANAVERVCGVRAGIKWVNDIYVSGRKVCGILTESSLASDGSMRYAVLGIGINVAETVMPDELREKAGSLGCDPAVRPRLAAELLSCFFAYYDELPAKAYMDEYRSRSVLDGKTIGYEKAGKLFSGTVIGIDDDARLMVRDSDGNVTYLSSGEVNIMTRVSDMR